MIGALVLAATLTSPLQSALDTAHAYGFSGVALIARGETVLLEEARGVTSVETAFDIGSITKPITAAAILKLQDEGRLSLDDPLSRFFTNVPGDKRAITVAQLLAHTSGISYDGNEDEALTRDQLVAAVFASGLESKPGEQWAYSNGGYNLLAAIIELASGMAYEQYLARAIFIPAKMTQTGYVLPRWKDLARGRAKGKDRGTPRTQPGWLPDGPSWNLRGAGGLISTARDLRRFHRLVKPAAMFEPRAELPPNPFGWTHGTYGWFLKEQTRLHHGSNGVFFALLRHDTRDDLLVILLANTQDEGNFANENALMVLADQLATAAAPSGVYRTEGGELEVSTRDRWLFVEARGQSAIDAPLGWSDADAARAARLTARAKELHPASEILGTTRPWWTPGRELVTFLRKEGKLHRLHWNGDAAAAPRPSGVPPLRIAYLPDEEGHYRAYHPFSERCRH